MTEIKLCGLTRAEDIEAANRLRPDYIGLVFAKKSKRYVTPEKAASLKALLAEGIKAVGVFVNEPPEQVAKLRGLSVDEVGVSVHHQANRFFVGRFEGGR